MASTILHNAMIDIETFDLHNENKLRHTEHLLQETQKKLLAAEQQITLLSQRNISQAHKETPWKESWEEYEDYPDNEIINFGMHKGKQFNNVPSSYLVWCSKQETNEYTNPQFCRLVEWYKSISSPV